MPRTATKTRKLHIYRVEINGEAKLVRATSRAKALKVVTKDVTVAIPDANELVDMIKQGIEVEESEA